MGPPSVWQPTLLDGAPGEVRVDTTFTAAHRRRLTGGAWVEHVAGWVMGSADLFEQVRAAAPWASSERPMYDRVVAVPRLHTGRWPDPPTALADMADALSHRYGVALRSISANLYRDGADSVAWHGDRIGGHRRDTVVAILSLGSPRHLLLRPVGGGPSIAYEPRSGDLVVMGGTCQRTWQHAVPKRSRAGPRISVMFREAE